MKKRAFENGQLKDSVLLVQSSEDTGGEYTLLEVELRPGGSRYFHYHKKVAKRFTAIKGELVICVGKKEIRLQAGKSITIPVEKIHRFYNPGDSAITFRVMLTPGHEQLEHGLAIVCGLAAEGKLKRNGIPRNFDYMALLMTLTDTRIAGWYSLAAPLIRWRAEMAMSRGLHLELINKYCR